MTTSTTMLIPLTPQRVDYLWAQLALHGRGPGDRCTAPGCRDRHQCWHHRAARHQLAGGGYDVDGQR